jgi:hypothetical protein
MGSPNRFSLVIRRQRNTNKRNRRKEDGLSEPCEPEASNADISITSLHLATASTTVPVGLSSSCPLPASGRRGRLSSLLSRLASPRATSTPTTPAGPLSEIPQRCLADDLDNENDSSHHRRGKKKSKMGAPSCMSSSTSSTRSNFNFFRRISSPIALQVFQIDHDGGESKETEESHGGSNSEDSQANKQHRQSVVERTKVLPNLNSPERSKREQSSPHSSPTREETGEHEDNLQPRGGFECATAILQHSYLERICGIRSTSFENDEQFRANLGLVDDPTVQESIECIFASQLEDGLELWDEDEEDDHHHSSGMNGLDLMRVEQFPERRREDLVSPAELQQSRMNRNDRKDSVNFSMTETRKRYEQASLVYVGTYDPTIEEDESVKHQHTMGGATGAEPLPCPCASNKLPAMEPKNWPQAPLLLRPTPGSGTRVIAVRHSNSKKDPLWVPGSHLTWSDRLAKNWGRPCEEQPHYACCERCVTLPINNGNEEPGHSLVIDFESDLFEGTLLLRMRFSEGTTSEPYDDGKGYFKGMNRRYQACVRGRFKKAIPFTETVTGFRFDRRCGKLPAKWVLRGGLKVLSFFAPQLDAKLEGERPHSLTPLGSTPQCIAVDDSDEGANQLEGAHEEPVEAHRTLFGESFAAPTSLQRAKMRKKVFDKLFVQQAQHPMTDPSKVYTFEFLQHLFNFQDFSIELGSMLGSVQLKDVLDGQPLQIMAAHGEQPLWSFDIWHQCLWEEAMRHHEARCQDEPQRQE